MVLKNISFDDGDTATFPWHIFQCVPVLKYTIHSFIHTWKDKIKTTGKDLRVIH